MQCANATAEDENAQAAATDWAGGREREKEGEVVGAVTVVVR